MFRITQTFLVNALVTYLRQNNWEVLYEDYVNARRGGAGPQGAVNYCFETIVDKFPDIVAVKEQKMLIIEVNMTYKHRYAEKLNTFNLRKDELFRCIKGKLDLDLEELELGMAFLRRPRAKAHLRGFHIWLYDQKLRKFIKYE